MVCRLHDFPSEIFVICLLFVSIRGALYLLIIMSVFRVNVDSFRFLLSDCLHRISHLLSPSSSLWLLGRSVRQFGFVASHQSAMSTPGVLLCQCPFNDSSRRKRGGQFAVDTSQIDLSWGSGRAGYSPRVRCSGCAALMGILPFVSL
jgi:hypothetical protein